MENNLQPVVKALTPGELASMYGVSTKTLKTWIDMHIERIGVRSSKYFTALQVKKIFDCLGLPNSEYRD